MKRMKEVIYRNEMNYMCTNERNIFAFSSCFENCIGKNVWKKVGGTTTKTTNSTKTTNH